MLDCYESSPVIGEWEMACGFCFDYVEVLKTLDKAVSDGWSNDGSKDALDTPAKARAAVQKLLNRRFPEASLAQRAAIATLFAEGGLAPGPERDVAVRALRALILEYHKPWPDNLLPDSEFEEETERERWRRRTAEARERRDAAIEERRAAGEDVEEPEDEDDDLDAYYDAYPRGRTVEEIYRYEVADADDRHADVIAISLDYYLRPICAILSAALGLPPLDFVTSETEHVICCLRGRSVRGATIHAVGEWRGGHSTSAVAFDPDAFQISDDDRTSLLVFWDLFGLDSTDALDLNAHALYNESKNDSSRMMHDHSGDWGVTSRVAQCTNSHPGPLHVEGRHWKPQWIHICRVSHPTEITQTMESSPLWKHDQNI